MNKILSEQKFQMSGCVAQECRVEAGQLLGVGKIVSGSVGLSGKTYFLALQLIVELSATDECKCEIDELLGSTRRLAKKLLGEKDDQSVKETKLPEPTTVAKAKTEEIAKVKETARDGRFIAYDNGTVMDTRTSLMWAAKDNGSNINWQNAKNYCENYREGGYSDWRMPMQDELAELYDPTKTYQSECKGLLSTFDLHLTELIRLTFNSIWASEMRGSEAAIFLFRNGERYWTRQSGAFSAVWALPVRSVK